MPAIPTSMITAAGFTRACKRVPRRRAAWSTKWAIKLPCMAVIGTSNGARVRVTARITTPPAAPSCPDVAFSSTGKPITRIALAPDAAMEWEAPRRNVAMLPGVRSRAALRAAGDTVSISTQATAPPTVAHRNPVRSQPRRNAAVAITTRMTASVTIRAP